MGRVLLAGLDDASLDAFLDHLVVAGPTMQSITMADALGRPDEQRGLRRRGLLGRAEGRRPAHEI